MKKLFLLICLFYSKLYSQDTTGPDSTVQEPLISWSGYVDGYYAYYTDSAGHGNFQKFPTVSPRSEQFGLNIIMLMAQYEAEKVRGLACLHFGDIAKSSWSGSYNNILEAHAGVRIVKKLWLDAGFFRTHVGAESLYPRENMVNSIAIGTYFEPYYQAGLKLNYIASPKLMINLFLLNGYNIYEENNNKKSIGILAIYSVDDKLNFGYNNYLGDDTPPAADSISHLRLYNNIFVNYQYKKFKVQFGGDYALQENADTSGKKNASMMSALLSAKYKFTKKCGFYARGEMISDEHGFITGVIIDKNNRSTGLKLWGAAAGVEYCPTENSYLRLEARRLQADDSQQIFLWKGWNRNDRVEIMANLGVSF